MSQSTHATPKQIRMAAVQAAIAKTKMTTAKLWNPWPDVVDDTVDIKTLKAVAGGGNVPEIIPDGRRFSDLKPTHLTTLGTEAGLGGPVTQGTFDEARQKIKSKYVATGRANYRELANANCTLFACCVIGMLAAQPKLLGSGVKVELLNLLDTTGGGGHAYVVVGRAEGDVGDIETYGPDCFFIDQWYARHKSGTPGVQGVKDAIPGESPNPFWDPGFHTFVSEGTSPAVKLTFTSDELSKLGL
ncbi:hypothetical protein GCM10022252_54690 [Streptosporangium oxazolinicum]|uniref:Uncharacterized protein n=1 Tax=Streptosporangium oxazolinicum TaxID=909287 RepID=A0ABP8B8M1_9ACTN